MLKSVFIIPFILQAVLIFFDEVVFHLKRGLPRFERIGHPLDTLTVIACLTSARCFSYSLPHLVILIGMALFSCLFVTKDEWVHFKVCPPMEMWLHALLFLNHPFLLGSLIALWLQAHEVLSCHHDRAQIQHFFDFQIAAVTLFFFYQVIYWNFIRKPDAECQ